MHPRVLVAGIGNVFCTDDGFGSVVAARMAENACGLPEGVRVVDYGIRGLHLAYDLLDGWDTLILLDALPGSGTTGRLDVLRIDESDVTGRGQLDAHGMDPTTVLAMLRTMGGTLPTTTVLVGCRVEDIAEGMGLTPLVEAAVGEAERVVRELVFASSEVA